MKELKIAPYIKLKLKQVLKHFMDIHSLLDHSTILANIKVSTKNDLINKLIDSLDSKVDNDSLESIRESVFDREEIMSTGVGKQLAIPHGKTSAIDENIASFALLKDPIDYDSVDDQPVKMVFLLVGPDCKNSNHIKLLSRISRLMNSSTFREKLLDCETADEIYQTFEKEEKEYFSS